MVLSFLSWFLEGMNNEAVINHVISGRVLGKTSVIEYPDSIYVFMRQCFNYDYLERPNCLDDYDTEKLVSLGDDLNLWLRDPYHRDKSFYANASLLQIST